MAAEDPANDPRANYDYGDGVVDRPALVEDLDRLIEGEVRFDRYSRQLYATDASAYEQTPIGVVFPRTADDVAAVMAYCHQRSIPVLPRGGGTSLAGQAVNEAVVLDISREMDAVVEIDPEGRSATAEVGVVLGDLNAELAPYGLKFAPDPAWADKSVLGGAIGNNSTGAHSLVYEKTDAYLESLEVVLSDGTVTTFGEVSMTELRARAGGEDLESRIYSELVRIIDEEADEINDRYPDLTRNVSGYDLDVLVEQAERDELNLAAIMAGSEGTFGIVTEATIGLEPVPATKSMALLTYDDLLDAMEDVAPILAHGPSAIEVMDDVLLDLARETEEFADVVGMLPEGTNSVLLVEFYADSDAAGEQQVANLLADRVGDVESKITPMESAGETTATARRAVDAMEAHTAEERAQFWKMRKSGLPILLSRTTDEKHIAFIEDTAIPAEELPAYVADFQAILDDHDTHASFYAHAGPGVLHIRPLVNTKTIDGVDAMVDIADAVTDLVVKYEGSVSGEHGDGRARTVWNRKLYGQSLWETFRELKAAFDPNWLLNPGQVCGYASDEPLPEGVPERARAVSMYDNLRFDPDYDFDEGFEPSLKWPNENGFQGMAELCHGCGGCRGPQHTTGGVMCPTYRASQEEITATRGRANLLRQAMSGDLPDEQFAVEFMHEVMDLCIGCKGCARDCPSEVDMAKLKAEIAHQHHQRNGASFRDRLFANIDRLARLGSTMAPVSNWLATIPGSGWLLEKTVGIARERSLPQFQRESFIEWMVSRRPAVRMEDADRRVLLVPDTMSTYSRPDIGRAAVNVLEAANCHVTHPDGITDVGRPALSKGFLDEARTTARAVVDALAPRAQDGWDIVVLEPSDAVMIQSDYADLLTDGAVDTVRASTYGLCEYLDRTERLDAIEFEPRAEHLTYHGHCHQKATKKDDHAAVVLEAAGYTVDRLDSGCCGMAGSFGYEAEHYSMSQAIGRILFDQVEASPGDAVVAPGASCRAQLSSRRRAAEEPPHPIEKVAEALAP